MKCTNCGYETQPGAKFCVQCGTTLIPPAGTGATPAPPTVSAASPGATSVGATAPRPTTAAPSAASLSATMARAAAASSPPAAASRPPPGPGAGVPPPAALPGAETSSGGKSGLIIALVAVVAALGLGGYFGYRMLFPDTADSAATQSSPPAARTSNQPAEAAKETSLSAPVSPAPADSASVKQAPA